MQIVIVGAQCVGKTTLVNDLAERYPTDIIKELVRDAVKLNPDLKVNENGTDESQKFLFDMYVDVLSDRFSYISDRSMFDVTAYTKVMYEYGNVSEETLELLYNRLVDFLNEHPNIQHYHIPPMFPIVGDGFRSVSKEFQTHTEKAICWLDERLRNDERVKHYNMFTTQTADHQKRMEELNYFINN